MTTDDDDSAEMRQAMQRLPDIIRSDLPTVIAQVREAAAEAEATRADPSVSLEIRGAATNVALACQHFLEQAVLPIPLTDDRVNLLVVAFLSLIGAEVTGVIGGMQAQHLLATALRSTVDPRLVPPSVLVSAADLPEAPEAPEADDAYPNDAADDSSNSSNR